MEATSLSRHPSNVPAQFSVAVQPPHEEAICFGSMRLYRTSGLLIDGDVPVRLGGRAMDLLIALVDRAPSVVTRAELETLVWPRTVVEESSLRVQIGALRKILGDNRGGVRYIANVPGRGYSFVAPISMIQPTGERPQAGGAAPHVESRHNLPVRLTKMIGRSTAVESVMAILTAHRLVTIAGPGGIGKTTLAIAVGEEALGASPRAALFVDLSVLSERGRVAATIGDGLGLTIAADNPHEILAQQLRGRDDLLILDNCEHVVEEVAKIVAGLLKAAPDLHIIATSREALQVAGEKVYLLDALPAPPADMAITADEALAYPSVALLVERAASDFADFELTDADAQLAGELCRRLDGLPLAIEMAAARIGVFGLRDLVARLDDRLALMAGNRTTLPRHQTLHKLYDWSYVQLSDRSQEVLRSLSVFAGSFSLAAASRVAAGEMKGESAGVVEVIAHLAAKSLIVPDFNSETVRYRLLVTARHFAREKLKTSSLRNEVHRRHARYLVDELEAANREWVGTNRVQWTASYGRLFDEVLHALNWATSPGGNIVLGAELALVAAHLAHQLSAVEGYWRYLIQVHAKFAAEAHAQPLLDMRLHIVLACVLGLTGAPLPDVEALYRKAVDAASRLGNGLHDAETPYGMFLGAFHAADYPKVLDAGHQIETVSRTFNDDGGVLIGRRMLCQANHYLGRHRVARDLALQVLRGDRRLVRLGGYWIDPVDRQVSMRIVLARLFWMQGEADSAEGMVRECLELGAAEMYTVQCQILGTAACPIALWSGDLDAARRYAAELTHIATKRAMPFWQRWSVAYETVLGGGQVHLSKPVDNMLWDMLCTIAPQCVDLDAVARVSGDTVGWCGPEVLRVWGDRLAREGAAEEARHFYDRSLELAAQQGALAWELRTTVSVARLLQGMGRFESAMSQLRAIMSRFTEGHGSADFRAARALEEDLRSTLGQEGPARLEHSKSRRLL